MMKVSVLLWTPPVYLSCVTASMNAQDSPARYGNSVMKNKEPGGKNPDVQ
jgi:hypothetical protein